MSQLIDILFFLLCRHKIPEEQQKVSLQHKAK
jgi:hypothetical protein